MRKTQLIIGLHVLQFCRQQDATSGGCVKKSCLRRQPRQASWRDDGYLSCCVRSPSLLIRVNDGDVNFRVSTKMAKSFAIVASCSEVRDCYDYTSRNVSSCIFAVYGLRRRYCDAQPVVLTARLTQVGDCALDCSRWL